MIVLTKLNGRIPEAFLATLPGNDGNGGPHQAERYAVAAYDRLRAQMKQAGQGDLIPSAGFSCYRTLADQAYMKRLGLTMLEPGKSFHGEALAVDFAGLSGNRLAWMRSNAKAYGWYQPSWAINGIHQGGKQIQAPEPWHWEYDRTLDRYTDETPPPEEDDMSAFAEQQIAEIHAAIGAGGAVGLPVENTVLGRLTFIQSQVNGLPQAISALQSNTSGVPEVLAAIQRSIADLQTLEAEVAGVLYAGTPGTPVDQTIYQKVGRIEHATVK